MKLWSAILTACLLGVAPTYACKYNVRDVGFVELGLAPYKLYCLIDRDTPKEFADTFRHTAHATLLDANVEFEIVSREGNENHPALSLARAEKIDRFPAALLVADDSSPALVPGSSSSSTRTNLRSLALTFSSAEKNSVWPVLESVVSSPKRDELLGKIADAFAIVVLVDGANAKENERARSAAEGAVAQLTKAMDRLPKPVKFPPQLMVISREAAAREKVLLWSLGLEATSPGDPVAAVVYGRGRRLGGPLQGALITQTELFNYLSMIGQDCECSLDRAWMRGPVMPARWDSDLQNQVVKSLGFDAESPLIKSEIGQILARGPNPNARRVALDDRAATDALGYKEINVEETNEAGTGSGQAPSTNATPALVPPTFAMPGSTNAIHFLTVADLVRGPFVVVLGLGGLALVIGVFVLLKRKPE